MTDVPCGKLDLPPRILEAVTALWEAQFGTETQAIDSGRFQMLRHICSSVYPEIPGSRLPNSPTGDFDRQQFHGALCRFFRWIGAPWYPPGPWQSAERAAEQLHAAFLLPKVKRTYLVPLDRLGLYDTRTYKKLRRVPFGKCEIILLDTDNFAEYVPLDALRRFEQKHWLEPETFAGFYYLVISEEEQAGAIWERSTWGFFHATYDLSTIDNAYPFDTQEHQIWCRRLVRSLTS